MTVKRLAFPALAVASVVSIVPLVLNALSLNVAAIQAVRLGLDTTWTTNWSWDPEGRLPADGRRHVSDPRPAGMAAHAFELLRSRLSDLHGVGASHLGAAVAFEAGDFAHAREILSTLVEMGGERPWEPLGLVKLYESRREHGSALREARRGTTAHDLLVVAGRSLSHGEIETARRLAELVVEAVPDSPEANLFLGHLLVLHGGSRQSAERAIGMLTRGLRVDPDNPELRINLAHALVESGRFSEASVALRALVAEEPRNPIVHLLLGEASRNQGDLVEAAREFSASFELDRSQLWALYGLGQVYAAEHRNSDAIAVWQRALQIDSSFVAAADALNSVK